MLIGLGAEFLVLMHNLYVLAAGRLNHLMAGHGLLFHGATFGLCKQGYTSNTATTAMNAHHKIRARYQHEDGEEKCQNGA